MLPIWAIEAGVKGLSSLYGLAKGKPKFGDTAYGKQLKMRTVKGDIPLEAQQNVISNVAKETGNAASMQKAEERGRLASTGMGNSISGTAGVRDIDTRYQDRLATVSRDLAAQNELTKAQAKQEYGQASTQWDEQRREEKAGNVAGLFGAVGQAIVGKYQQDQGTISGVLGQSNLTPEQQYAKLIDLKMEPEDAIALLENHWQMKPDNTQEIDIGKARETVNRMGGVRYAR
jgi:hypothetical protein